MQISINCDCYQVQHVPFRDMTTEAQRGEGAFSVPLRGLAWASHFWPSTGEVVPKAGRALAGFFLVLLEQLHVRL